ncbi:hypothetical protein BT69DRAFT_716522, partial [Atractiella rhizophila]
AFLSHSSAPLLIIYQSRCCSFLVLLTRRPSSDFCFPLTLYASTERQQLSRLASSSSDTFDPCRTASRPTSGHSRLFRPKVRSRTNRCLRARCRRARE